MKIFWAIVTILTMFIGLDFSGKAMKVDQVWARAVPMGTAQAYVFALIDNNTGDPDSLVVVSSKAAETATMQETTIDNGVESTHEVKNIHFDPGEKKTLKPHGAFIMLTGLNRALVVGDTVPVNLTFTKAGLIETTAHIEQPNATIYDKF